jgi:leucyl-tRNA synthetase
MLTAFAYKDPTGRLVPSDEVEERDGKFVHVPSGQVCEQVVAKMSKSLRNVVNPDSVIEQYGCDTFRLYEMFMGPLGDSQPWNPRDVPGCRRFLERAWRMIVDPEGHEPCRPGLAAAASGPPQAEALDLERALARTLEQVDDSFEHFNFNTAIAGLMSFLNEVGKRPGALRRDQAERFVLALSPFAPHVAEELWERLGHEESVGRAPWPKPDPKYLEQDEYELVVQVQGKLRGKVRVAKSAPQAELEERARAAVAGQLDGKQIVKSIVVPGKLVNFVVK